MGKMSEDIKMQRNLKKLAALMGTAAPLAPEKITRETAREARATKPSPLYDAEAVLLFLQKPARFMVKPCKREECQEPFGTNYRGVGYCSDNCRIKELKRFGIQWDPSKTPEERWQGEAPLLIPPEALKVLIHLAQSQSLNADAESPLQEISSQETSSTPAQEQVDSQHTQIQTLEVTDHGTTAFSSELLKETQTAKEVVTFVFDFQLARPIFRTHHGPLLLLNTHCEQGNFRNKIQIAEKRVGPQGKNRQQYSHKRPVLAILSLVPQGKFSRVRAVCGIPSISLNQTFRAFQVAPYG